MSSASLVSMLTVSGSDGGGKVVVGFIMRDRLGYLVWDRMSRPVRRHRFSDPLEALAAVRGAYFADHGRYPAWLTVGGDR